MRQRLMLRREVQLWTMNNYHYYLKQELFPTKQEGEPARFTSMAWHTEKPLTLYLTGKGKH